MLRSVRVAIPRQAKFPYSKSEVRIYRNRNDLRYQEAQADKVI